MEAEVERIIERLRRRLSGNRESIDPILYARIYATVKGTGSFLEEWMCIDIDLLRAAAEVVSEAEYGSNELLRQRLRLGYNRAHTLIRWLQQDGILGTELDEHARLELKRSIGFY
jgi:DNA segregation ATPase FtsK/SpoIIIE-like protein